MSFEHDCPSCKCLVDDFPVGTILLDPNKNVIWYKGNRESKYPWTSDYLREHGGYSIESIPVNYVILRFGLDNPPNLR